ncbi:MAG: efflux RND transporter periplasmic adaptor subunit [Arenicella sp.]|nr:efflux RND transporter periplasmic adaptor subunit [Arenicella sp.]
MNLRKAIKANLSSNMKLRASIILTGALLLVLAGYYFGWFSNTSNASQAPSGPPPTPVRVAQAVSMTMAPHTLLPGTVVSLRDSVIASETSGKIISIANVGDIIEEGGVIARIDPRDAQQMVDQRRAELQRLKSQLTYHSNYYDRVSASDDTLGVPEIVVAEKLSNREVAKADVASAKVALESAERDLKRTFITAPFAGRVVSQSIQTGEYAQTGAPIARLVDIENLEVSAQVPASLVQPISPGTLLQIRGMGKTLQAPMRALVPVGDSVSRTMELRVELKDSGLLVGSPVRVSLPSAQPKDVVAIPRDALILRTDKQYVFVVDDEGRAHQRSVELGYAQKDMIEVLGDVAPLARVVVRGGERLRDGQAVKWDGQDENAKDTATTQTN